MNDNTPSLDGEVVNVVAAHVRTLVEQLEGVGLLRPAILDGLEQGLTAMRRESLKRH